MTAGGTDPSDVLHSTTGRFDRPLFLEVMLRFVMRPFEILSRLGRSVTMASSLMCLVGLAVVHGVAHGQAARSPGQALPADAAATVNGTVVSKTEFDRALAAPEGWTSIPVRLRGCVAGSPPIRLHSSSQVN